MIIETDIEPNSHDLQAARGHRIDCASFQRAFSPASVGMFITGRCWGVSEFATYKTCLIVYRDLKTPWLSLSSSFEAHVWFRKQVVVLGHSTEPVGS